MKIRSLALAVTLAAAPLPLLAQTTPAPDTPRREMRDGARMQHRPLERLMAQRERLGLSAEQVTRLEAVQERLRSRNAPLLEQVHQNRHGAEEEVRAILTEEQRTRLRELRRDQRRSREGRHARPGHRGGRRGS